MHQLLVAETLFAVTTITLLDSPATMLLGSFAAAYSVDVAVDS